LATSGPVGSAGSMYHFNWRKKFLTTVSLSTVPASD
jgi:hypothetical protein